MASINFPNFPTDGQKFTFNGEVWIFDESKNQWLKNLQSDNSVDIQFPELPTRVSQLNNDSGYLTSITNNQIVTALGYQPINALAGVSASTYINEASFPASGNTPGDLVYSISTKRLYFWNGSAFVAIAYVNDSPVVSGLQSLYEIDSFNTSESIELIINELQNQDTTITVNRVSNSWNVNISAQLGETDSYYLSGRAVNGVNGANADILMYRGDTITFDVSAPNNPVYIKTNNSTGSGSQASSVINNGTENGTIVFTPTSNGTYYYNSQFNTNMDGTIEVRSRPTNILNSIVDGNTITFTPNGSGETGSEAYNIIVSDGQASTVLNTRFNISYSLKYPSNLRVRNTSVSYSSRWLDFSTLRGANINPILKNYSTGPNPTSNLSFNNLYGIDTNPETSTWNTAFDLNAGNISARLPSAEYEILNNQVSMHLNYPYYVSISSTTTWRLWRLSKSNDSLTYADTLTQLSAHSFSAHGIPIAIIQNDSEAYILLVEADNGDSVFNIKVYDIETDTFLTYVSPKERATSSTVTFNGQNLIIEATGTNIKDTVYTGLRYFHPNQSIVVDQRYVISRGMDNSAGRLMTDTTNYFHLKEFLLAIHDTGKSSSSLLDAQNWPNLGYIVPGYHSSDEAITSSYFNINDFAITDDSNYIVILSYSDLIIYQWTNKSNPPVYLTTYYLDNDFSATISLSSGYRGDKGLHVDNNIIYVASAFEMSSYQINNNVIEKLGHVTFPTQSAFYSSSLNGSRNINIFQYKEYLCVSERISEYMVAIVDSVEPNS